jgi:hypothetical protein
MKAIFTAGNGGQRASHFAIAENGVQQVRRQPHEHNCATAAQGLSRHPAT